MKVKKLKWKLNTIIQPIDDKKRQYIARDENLHRNYYVQNYLNNEKLKNGQYCLEVNHVLYYLPSLKAAKEWAQLDYEATIYNLFFIK